MFSPDIVASDAFLEMPVSAQALYFHLGMKADDDGFVSPRSTMRLVGAGEDDLKVLIGKRFVLPFESGVVVIKHWLIHNLIRADMYKETLHKKEKALLGLNENGAYTELREGVSELKTVEAPKWLKERRKELRTANVPQTVPRLGKGREDSGVATAPPVIEVGVDQEHKEKRLPPAKYPNALTVFAWFPNRQASWESLKESREREYAEYLYVRGEDAVRGILAFCQKHDGEEFFPAWKSPSKLEKNWTGIQDFAKRNGL